MEKLEQRFKAWGLKLQGRTVKVGQFQKKKKKRAYLTLEQRLKRVESYSRPK